MKVERPGIADIDALVRLRLEYLREDNGGLARREADAIQSELPAYFADALGRDLFAYAIREGGDIVSCALLLVVTKPMSPAFLNGKTGIVLNVYTRPPFRRRGYAREIMRTLMADAREMELASVELKATEDGYSLYRSLGFSDDRSKYRPMKWRNR